jgi:molecular chaperone GrpE
MTIFKKKADMAKHKDEQDKVAAEAILKGEGPSAAESRASDEVCPPNMNGSADDKNASSASGVTEQVIIDRKEYEDLKAKVEEFLASRDSLLRTVADFENSKKRIEKQKDEFIQYANKKIILEFLPIMDNLTRAIESAKANHSVDSMITGVDLINKQLQDLLKMHGLERIASVGTLFDPHKHEAIGTVASEVHDEDIVAEEITPGYMYKDTLLRASVVRVSSGKSVPQVDDEDAAEDNQE